MDSIFQGTHSRYQLFIKFPETVNIFGKEVSVYDTWTKIKRVKN